MDGVKLPQPEGWDDKSMIAYNARERPESGIIPNIVITQAAFGDAAGDTPVERIKAFANKQIAEMKDKLPEAAVQSQTLLQVAGRPAAEVNVTWQHGASRLAQLVTFVARNPSQVLICTGTAAENEFDQHRDAFRRAVQTVQIAS